jgi:Fur family ferric uptake transcriptional regulator/Fur family peroxide stress response transcriptional regulator
MATRKNAAGVGRKAAKLTRQREVILQAVKDLKHHPTAAQIFERAKALLPTISYATVYNSLRYLKGAGLIGEVTLGKGLSRYESETSRHDHAFCTRCGRLVDIQLPETDRLMREAARQTQFEPQTIYLTLFGLCPECSQD